MWSRHSYHYSQVGFSPLTGRAPYTTRLSESKRRRSDIKGTGITCTISRGGCEVDSRGT